MPPINTLLAVNTFAENALVSKLPQRRRPFFIRLAPALCAIALAAASSLADAQSLRELYEAARSYDATYLAARALADSAQFRAEQALALNRPNVNLTAGATRTDTDGPFVLNQGQPIPGTGGYRSSNRVEAAVNATQPLYNRSNDAVISQAQRGLEVSMADLEVAEQDLIVRVALAYADVVVSEDSLSTAQASKRAIAEQLASAKRNFEVGTATITDTREAQARFDLSTAQEIAADNDLRTKRIALDQLIGRRGVAPKRLAPSVELSAPAPDDVNQWVGVAETEHPLVRKAQLALEIAKLETERARASEGLTLDLVGRAGGDRTVGSLSSQPGNTTNTVLGLQLKMPLYTGGLTQNRIKETLSLEEKARNDLDAARRGVAQGTRVSFFSLRSGLAQVKALAGAECSGRLALEATQLGYKVGVRVNLDVLNAQTQVYQTQRDLSRARYDVLVAGLRLRQASGQLRAEHVNAFSELLEK
jgi:outer membrane protein